MIETNRWYDVREATRTYNYVDGSFIVLSNVKRLLVSASGYHYLEAGRNRKYIIPPGWFYISFEGEWLQP